MTLGEFREMTKDMADNEPILFAGCGMGGLEVEEITGLMTDEDRALELTTYQKLNPNAPEGTRLKPSWFGPDANAVEDLDSPYRAEMAKVLRNPIILTV
jgi:hypothetical protein